MCLGRRPKAPPPPPPPPPPPAETADEMAEPGQATNRRMGRAQRARRRGTSALKIRLASNLSGGSGTNVGY